MTLHRDRPSVRVTYQPVIDLHPPALTGPVVIPKRSQRTGPALEVAARHVIERQPAVVQVPGREPALNPILTLQKPIHRGVHVIVNSARDTQLRPQGAGLKLTRQRQLGATPEHPAGDHRHTQIPLPGRLAVDQPG
jgi:hypothetical protein